MNYELVRGATQLLLREIIDKYGIANTLFEVSNIARSLSIEYKNYSDSLDLELRKFTQKLDADESDTTKCP